MAGCQFCRDDRYNFQRVFSLGNYEGELKDAVLKGKYGQDQFVLKSLSERLFQTVGHFLSDVSVDVVVPVPNHWVDRISVKVHASSVIANHLSRSLKLPIDRHILRKCKRTPKQQSLNPTERRKNLKGAFVIQRGINLSGLSVLLVDDVLTTGTTCHRAARELFDTGAKDVWVAVLARGVGA